MSMGFRVRLQRTNGGGALVAGLVLMALLAALGAGLVRLQTSIQRRRSQSIDAKRSLYVSEAGLAEALFAISLGKSGAIASPEIPASWGGGVYWVESKQDSAGNRVLVCTGLAGRGRSTITTVVQPRTNPIATAGIGAFEALSVGAGAVLDGYDSSLGSFEDQLDTSYAFPTTGQGALLTCNGDIDIEGPPTPSADVSTFVFGDARPGVSGVVRTDPGVVLTGSSAARDHESRATPIALPVIDTTRGTATLSGTLAPGRMRYDAIHVRSGETLRLKGPLTLVTDTLDVSGRLEVDGSQGKVELFVLQTLRLEAGSELETLHRRPQRFGLFLGNLGQVGSDYQTLAGSSASLPPAGRKPDEALRFQPRGTFYGLIYAPFSDLSLPADLRLFGAVVARRLTLAPQARVSLDRDLLSSNMGGSALPRLQSWRFDTPQGTPLTRSPIDPLIMLRRAGHEPLASSQAHQEQLATINYRDTDGTHRTFVGDLSELDWDEVDAVDSVQWNSGGDGGLSAPVLPVGRQGPGNDAFIFLVPEESHG